MEVLYGSHSYSHHTNDGNGPANVLDGRWGKEGNNLRTGANALIARLLKELAFLAVVTEELNSSV